jgi:acetoin utilization deacetylase AcuC-like enzyme
VELISSRSFVELHRQLDHFHAERPERLQRLLERFPEFTDGRPATRSEIERLHAPAYADHVRSLESDVWLDADTYAGPTTYAAA